MCQISFDRLCAKICYKFLCKTCAIRFLMSQAFIQAVCLRIQAVSIKAQFLDLKRGLLAFKGTVVNQPMTFFGWRAIFWNIQTLYVVYFLEYYIGFTSTFPWSKYDRTYKQTDRQTQINPLFIYLFIYLDKQRLISKYIFTYRVSQNNDL